MASEIFFSLFPRKNAVFKEVSCVRTSVPDGNFGDRPIKNLGTALRILLYKIALFSGKIF